MARRTVTVKITEEGRDRGKTFHITEMPAVQAEAWAIRALLALATNINVTDDEAARGMAQLSTMSMVKIAAGMDYEDARPLMEELMACVQIVPDPSRPDVMRSDIVHDVEEVATLMKLKLETYKLHTSFSPLAVTSTSTSTTSQAGQAPSRSTRTSPGR